MSDFDYPQVLKGPFGPFPKIPQCKKPQASTSAIRVVNISLGGYSGNSQRVSSVDQTQTPGIIRLALCTEDGRLKSDSFNDSSIPAEKAIKSFCFCPGADTMHLGWKAKNPAKAGSAKLEIFASRLDKPVASKELTADALGQNALSASWCTGSIALEDLEWNTQYEDFFPDKVFTVEYSPYQARLTMEPPSSSSGGMYPKTAWTFFQILVDKIEIAVGDPKQIPERPEGEGQVASMAESITEEEKTLVTELQSGNKIKAKKIDLPLKCDLVCAFPPGDSDLEKDEISSEKNRASGSNYAMTATWGKGPRIPLTAKVFLKTVKGSSATLVQSKTGLGRAWFMWDWRDNPDKWQDWLKTGAEGNSKLTHEYIKGLVTTKEDVQPLGSTNCPKKFGGKRGDTDWPVFPSQEKDGTLGYEVVPAGDDRPWSALSRGGEGDFKGTSGVIFQPSCIPGDQYTVRVWLTSAKEKPEKGDKPMLIRPDVDPEDSDKPTPLHKVLEMRSSQPAPGDTTGCFEIFRKTGVIVTTLSGDDLDTLTSNVARYYKTSLGYILEYKKDVLNTNFLNETKDEGTRWDAIKNGFNEQQKKYGLFHWGISDPDDLGTTGVLVKTKSWNDYMRFIRSGFQENRSYAVPASLLDHAIKVGMWSKLGDATLYLLGKDGNVFLCVADQSFERDDCKHLQAYEINREEPEDGTQDHIVTVSFQIGPVTVRYTITYPKKGVRLLRSRTLPSGDREELTRTLKDLAEKDPGYKNGEYELRVTYLAKNNGDRNRVRCERLEDELKTILNQHFQEFEFHPVTIDTLLQEYNDAHYAYSGGFLWTPLSETQYYNQVFGVLKGNVESEIQKAVFIQKSDDDDAHFARHDDKGLLYSIWGPVCSNSIGNDGGFNAGNSDSFHGYCNHHHSGNTLVYERLISEEQDIMIHEMGHAFWRPHAPTSLFSQKPADGDKKDLHVKHDTCVMSYDTDPTSKCFCGTCILQIRGWIVGNGTHDRAEAKTKLEEEIDEFDALVAKAWRQMRRAWLASDEGNAQEARTWIEKAIDNLDRFDKPNKLSLLREAIVGLKKNQDTMRAENLWNMFKRISREVDQINNTGAPLFEENAT